ncbi:type VII secretion protein [Streptococcus equi]|uniref:type VII secretion protein n=1 Tax=Streptococcus equi TaxID=1336 RepID=UPI0026599056|nr:type VII secretion protein [Streptococcus equi]WKF66948.1 type VII secretion protein [Streptococcus equi subsp. zooepidemicus]
MENYISISLDCSHFFPQEFDLRVPRTMTFKELLQIVSDAYGLGFQVVNPSARNEQGGQLMTSTSCMDTLKNGALLVLENL